MSPRWNVVAFYPQSALCFVSLKRNKSVLCACGWQESQTGYISTAFHHYTLEAGMIIYIFAPVRTINLLKPQSILVWNVYNSY